jgi:hypothetical protein
VLFGVDEQVFTCGTTRVELANRMAKRTVRSKLIGRLPLIPTAWWGIARCASCGKAFHPEERGELAY